MENGHDMDNSSTEYDRMHNPAGKLGWAVLYIFLGLFFAWGIVLMVAGYLSMLGSKITAKGT